MGDGLNDIAMEVGVEQGGDWSEGCEECIQEVAKFDSHCHRQILSSFPNPIPQCGSIWTCARDLASAGPSRNCCAVVAYLWGRDRLFPYPGDCSHKMQW